MDALFFALGAVGVALWVIGLAISFRSAEGREWLQRRWWIPAVSLASIAIGLVVLAGQ